jgi:predicted phage tail component-like protein
MANRYWVGGTGNWSDNTNHWSDASGGSPGASLPTSADNVYFDANSFTTEGQTVTINVAANCLDMDWTGALYNPTMVNTGVYQNIYGNLTLISELVMGTNAGYFKFRANSTGKTIITAEKKCMSMYFEGVGGGWTLQDTVNIGLQGFKLLNGILNTNNKVINCTGNMYCIGTGVRTLTLGSSIIICSGNITFTSTGLTITENTSTLIITGNSKTFDGAGLTFNNIEFQGTPTTVTGSNTFNDLKLTAGKTVNFTAGTTQTINTLSGDGVSGSLITIQSTVAGSPFTISCAIGTILKDYYSIKDCTVTGGATFMAANSINVSGNTGWLFVILKNVGEGAVAISRTLQKIISKSIARAVTISGSLSPLKFYFFVTTDMILQPLGLLVTKINRSLMPPTRDNTEEIPGRHGEIDFGSEFGSDMIELEVATDDGFTAEEIESTKRTLAGKLNPAVGERDLVLENENNKNYKVKYSGKIPLDKYPTWMKFVIPFKITNPFANAVNEKSLTGSGTITNEGTFETPIIIEIPGPATSPTVSVGTSVISYTSTIAAGQTLIIDTATQTAKIGSVNAIAQVSGDIDILLEPGVNVSVVPSISSTVIKWRDKYL